MILDTVMEPVISLKRDYDIPMTLPGNDDWDIYSTINEPGTPSSKPVSSTEEEDDGFNQWEHNY